MLFAPGVSFALGIWIVSGLELVRYCDIEDNESKEQDEGDEAVLNVRLLEVAPLEQYDMLDYWVREEPSLAVSPLTLEIGDERLGARAVEDPGELYSLEENGFSVLYVVCFLLGTKEVVPFDVVLETSVVHFEASKSAGVHILRGLERVAEAPGLSLASEGRGGLLDARGEFEAFS